MHPPLSFVGRFNARGGESVSRLTVPSARTENLRCVRTDLLEVLPATADTVVPFIRRTLPSRFSTAMMAHCNGDTLWVTRYGNA